MRLFFSILALCTAACGVEVADLSRDGVTIKVDAEPKRVDPARDFVVTLSLSAPAGRELALPDLRDRFRGFRVAEDFTEDPVKDESGATTLVSRWRLEPEPAAAKYALRPFVVGSFCTAPVTFDPPAVREPVTGGVEIDPKRDLPPLSWKLVGRIAAVLAGLAGLVALLWLAVRRIREAVRVHRMSPIQRALYELESLLRKDLPSKGLQKDFYVELTQVVRRYIERQHGVRAPNLTTEEFFETTRKTDSFPKSTLDLLIDFLRRADMVKFAGVESTPPMVRAAIESARSYLNKDDEIVARKRVDTKKNGRRAK